MKSDNMIQLDHSGTKPGSNERQLRVIKLGGSLLGASQLKKLIDQWLEAENTKAYRNEEFKNKNIWIVGGGDFVNRLRVWQKTYSLTDAECHSIAIEMMAMNTEYIARKFDWQIVNGLHNVNAQAQSDLILDPTFLLGSKTMSDRFESMPCDWSVTSDSIAALVAAELNAHELVLLKSRSSANFQTAPQSMQSFQKLKLLEKWGDEELVDPYFSKASTNVNAIRIVNLRKQEQ